jgi:hypothetical protein
VPDDDERIDRLFALPPEEFTAARNALAKELRNEGKAARAEAVKKLARPNLGAWAVNQLARTKPEHVRELVDAGAKLRKAQNAGADVRNATAAERRALAAATAAAQQILAESNRKANETVLRTIRATLRAAAADADAAAELQRGRLTAELEPPSLSDLLAEMKPRARGSGPTTARERTRAEERARERLDEAKRRAEEKRADARAAAAEEKRLRRELDRASNRARKAAQAANTAESALRDLSRRRGAT